MDKNQDRALSLLDNVLTGFFSTGEMNMVTAYAMTVLAKAYIESSLDIDQLRQIITMYEDANDGITFIVPEDDSIQNQIRGLEELKSMLSCCPVEERDTMIIIKEDVVQPIRPSCLPVHVTLHEH